MNNSELWTRDDAVTEVYGLGPDSLYEDYDGELVAAIFSIREDGAALLQLRDEKKGLRHAGLWGPPGGHVERNESLKLAAAREFLEETGMVCNELRWLNALEIFSPPWPTFLLATFWFSYEEGQAFECLEGQELRFVKREQASDFPMPSFVITNWDRTRVDSGRVDGRVG